MTNNPVDERSFADFVFRDKKNRIFLGLAVLLSIALLFIFKHFWYPWANFWDSSNSLIEAASTNASVGLWPIGYSKYLWVIHSLTHSDTVVVAIQYFFLTGVLLYFFFTLHYFYRFEKNSFIVLFLFLFFDPLFLFLSNYITSDALFVGFSLWWFTDLVWIFRCPRSYRLVLNAILIFISFTLSYNAVYYPIVSLVILIFTRKSVAWRLTGIAISVPLLILFVVFTRNENLKITGVKQFSAYSGWRQANNALYMYPHIRVDTSHLPSVYVSLDSTVRDYFRECKKEYLTVSPGDGEFYVFQSRTPLHRYLYPGERWGEPIIHFPDWSKVSSLYGAYGEYLSSEYAGGYFTYYLLPNAGDYFRPGFNKLLEYNMFHMDFDPTVKAWFDYKQKLTPRLPRFPRTLLSPFPLFFPLINIAFLVGVIWFFLSVRQAENNDLSAGLMLVSILLFINWVFSIWTAPVVLESQIFPMIVCFGFVLLLYDFFEKKYKKA